MHYTFILVLPHNSSEQGVLKCTFFSSASIVVLSQLVGCQVGGMTIRPSHAVSLKVSEVSPIRTRTSLSPTCDLPHLSLSKDFNPCLSELSLFKENQKLLAKP